MSLMRNIIRMRLPDLELVGVDVGEVDHHAAALLELDHAVAGGRIGRIGQPVGRIGLDAAGHVGERMGLLRVRSRCSWD